MKKPLENDPEEYWEKWYEEEKEGKAKREYAATRAVFILLIIGAIVLTICFVISPHFKK